MACALVDLASLQLLALDGAWELFTRRPPPTHLELLTLTRRSALVVLARTIIYDSLIADLSRTSGTPTQPVRYLLEHGLLLNRPFSSHVYDRINADAASIFEFLCAQQHIVVDEPRRTVAVPRSTRDERIPLETVPKGDVDDWFRVIAYLLQAVLAKIPLILAPDRQDIPRALSYIATEAFRYLELEVDASARRLADPNSCHEYRPVVEIRIPPLAELVLRMATQHQISIVDAARCLRDSKEALAFRRWLRETSVLIGCDLPFADRAARVRFDSALKPVLNAAQQWASQAENRYGLRAVLFSLDQLPILNRYTSSVLKFLGPKLLFKKDRFWPVQPDHLAFISWWYTDPPPGAYLS